eukprot:768671-Hanusia_phi.AAC.2
MLNPPPLSSGMWFLQGVIGGTGWLWGGGGTMAHGPVVRWGDAMVGIGGGRGVGVYRGGIEGMAANEAVDAEGVEDEDGDHDGRNQRKERIMEGIEKRMERDMGRGSARKIGRR